MSLVLQRLPAQSPRRARYGIGASRRGRRSVAAHDRAGASGDGRSRCPAARN